MLAMGALRAAHDGTGLCHRLLLLTLDTHGTVRCTSAPAMVGMVGVGYDLAVTLVSRYGGAGGYLGYANCLLIGAGIEFEMEHARLEGVRGRTG